MRSLIDNDLYKHTMQQAVLELYPTARARYKFICRRATPFTTGLASDLREIIHDEFSHIRLQADEAEWMTEHCYYFKPWYIDYLWKYRFKPNEVTIKWSNEKSLEIDIDGPWHSDILWEVPLMSTISELYFDEQEDRRGERVSMSEYRERTAKKAIRLSSDVPAFQAGYATFTDFGTRRRRSYDIHNLVVQTLSQTKEPHHNESKFFGTSNMHFAKKYGLRPVGTMAHEWIMAHSVLSGLRHANRAALDAWVKVYRGELGFALTDTYGLKPFWEDFDTYYAKLFDGVRQDSDDPFVFADQAAAHYKKLRIEPMSKIALFTDSLDTDKKIALQDYCHGKIGCSFGIGTNFTNDVPDSPALNIVIKLDALNGEPVCKLGEGKGKASGHPTAIRLAQDTFYPQVSLFDM